MAEPLIDRDALVYAIFGYHVPSAVGRDRADRVLDYLRSVLTPEALWPMSETGQHVLGNTLHDRIFGEDK